MARSKSKRFENLLPNTWMLLCKEEDGARRHCALRYVPDGGYFLLWGYLSYDVYIYGGPHLPRRDNPEYDVVMFDPKVGEWQNQFPFEKADEWAHKLPPMYLCQNYHGITTGSYRPQLKVRNGVLRPDLNIVFDQVTYDSKRSRMVYFTGGRTFGYDVQKRSWADIGPGVAPPPILGGSLCYDPFNNEIVLFGGGHVAERGRDGKLVGYTGTWVYDCRTLVWRQLDGEMAPPPRMATRLVCDTQNEMLVLFGGDAQTHFFIAGSADLCPGEFYALSFCVVASFAYWDGGAADACYSLDFYNFPVVGDQADHYANRRGRIVQAYTTVFPGVACGLYNGHSGFVFCGSNLVPRTRARYTFMVGSGDG